MKKTLAAIAVLGAFAGTALAADVTLYGKIDAGLNYTHTKTDGATGTDDFSMKSGQNSGSRFGLKGTEQISEDVTVGFQLENGFNIDDGYMGQDDRLFGREARVYVKTGFGELGLGRMGGIDSGVGSYDLIADANPFGTGWGGATGQMGNYFLGLTTRYDNMITYKSPEFAGITVVAQASLKKDSNGDGDEGSHLADRYYAIGMGADYGALTGALTFSVQDYSGVKDRLEGAGVAVSEDYNDDDGYAVTGFMAYDFGVTKVSLGAQYFDGVNQARGSLNPTYTFDKDSKKGAWEYGDVAMGATGYGVILGAITPIAGGQLFTALGYADYEQSKLFADEKAAGADKADATSYGIGIGYQYPLSKRTYVYTAASWNRLTENDGGVNDKDVDTDTTEVMAGIVHNF